MSRHTRHCAKNCWIATDQADRTDGDGRVPLNNEASKRERSSWKPPSSRSDLTEHWKCRWSTRLRPLACENPISATTFLADQPCTSNHQAAWRAVHDPRTAAALGSRARRSDRSSVRREAPLQRAAVLTRSLGEALLAQTRTKGWNNGGTTGTTWRASVSVALATRGGPSNGISATPRCSKLRNTRLKPRTIAPDRGSSRSASGVGRQKRTSGRSGFCRWRARNVGRTLVPDTSWRSAITTSAWSAATSSIRPSTVSQKRTAARLPTCSAANRRSAGSTISAATVGMPQHFRILCGCARPCGF